MSDGVSICGPSQGRNHRLIYSLCIAEVCYFVQGCLSIVILFFYYVNILFAIVNLPMLIISWDRERESNGDLDYTGYSTYSPLQLLYRIVDFFGDILDYECKPFPLLSLSILWPPREDMNTPRQWQASFSQAFRSDSLFYNSADSTFLNCNFKHLMMTVLVNRCSTWWWPCWSTDVAKNFQEVKI
jgi:hypothetical protein